MAHSNTDRPYVLAAGAANMDIAGSTGNTLAPGDSVAGASGVLRVVWRVMSPKTGPVWCERHV